MTDEQKRVLETFPHFLELPEAERSSQLDAMTIAIYPEGTVMLEQGRRCRGAALVLSGTIRVYKLSPEGREITLYRIGAGETCVLAISCLLGGIDYPVIAAVEEEAEVAMLPVDALRAALACSEPWQRFLFAAMAGSMVDILTVLDEVAFRRMDARLASRLLQCPEGLVEFTHEQLAGDIGTAREVVSRLLKELENKGMVELRRGSVRILNRDGLKKIAAL